MPTPATTDIIAAARALIDVPFEPRGRTRFGVDCYGLIVVAYANLGVVLLDSMNYHIPCDPQLLISFLDRNFKRAHIVSRNPGDVLVFYVDPRTRDPQHVGFYTGEGVVHCNTATGKVVEHAWTNRMRRRALWGYRLRG